MRKWIRKAETVFVAMLVAGLCFTGCNTNTVSEQSKEKVFSYNGIDVNLDEVWLYADIAKAKYETQYGSMFGDSMWTMEVSQDDKGNPIILEEMVKDNVIDQIKQIIVLNKKAGEMKISLTEEEKQKAKESAKAFVSEDAGKAILEETGANQDLIQKVYEENAIASKVRQKMIEDVNSNISEEEARMTTVYKLVFPKTKTDQESGETLAMSAKELVAQKKKAEEAYQKLQSGTKIEDLAKEYKIESTTDETFAKGESQEGEIFETAVYKLKEGENTAVLDLESGYVIAKLVALTDKEATEQKKAEILLQRQNEDYNKEYTEWTKELEENWDSEKEVNKEAFDKIVFQEKEASTEGTTVTSTETKTDTATATSTEAKTSTTEATQKGKEATTATETTK